MNSAGANNQQSDFVLALAYMAKESEIFSSEDYFDINISSYKTGRMSGRFSAKLTPETNLFDYNNRGKTIITDGVITAVPVSY